MPKIVISTAKGLQENKNGEGLEIKSEFEISNEIKDEGAFYCGNDKVTAAATGSFPLLSGFVNTVDSGDNEHGVRLQDAPGAGTLMIIRNVDAGQDVVIRNENETGAILLTLGEGKTAIFTSTDSGGDSWNGSAVD